MKHIHIIGIGGTFMGGVAAIAKEAGFKVSGCDAKMYPPMSTQLEALGIDVHEGFDAAQLDEFKADIYVIGNVAKRGMDVIEAILNKGLPYTSGPQWLAENVLHQHWVLGVAGTHGKRLQPPCWHGFWNMPVLHRASSSAAYRKTSAFPPVCRKRRAKILTQNPHSSSSKPTNTTPPFSINAPNLYTTVRVPPF